MIRPLLWFLFGVLLATAAPAVAQVTGCTITGQATIGPFRLPITGTCSAAQGPAGPAGPAGAPGAPGPAGPPGPAAVPLAFAGTPGAIAGGQLPLPAGNYVVGQTAWDTANSIEFVCTTAGTASSSVWVPIGVPL